MTRVGSTLKRLWLLICTLVGIAATLSAIVMAIVLLLAVVVVVANGEFVEKWLVFQWMLVLSLSMFAFLNMLYFFSRLKRSNPDLYDVATEGWPVSAYIVSSKSAYRLLHGWVVKVVTDRSIPFVDKLRAHAKFTRYLNIVCLYGWLGQIFIMGGIFLYVAYIRPT